MTDRSTSTHRAQGEHRFPARMIFWCFATIAAFFLITEHAAHLFGVLPYLLLLACPLMHVFMHHGHGRHEDQGGHTHKTDDTSEGGN